MRTISIQVKILTGIIAVLFLAIVSSITLSVVNQRNAILDYTERSVLSTNGILNTVIRNIMLDGEAPLAVSTLEGLQEIAVIDGLQLFRADGSVAFSDYSTMDFVNSYQTSFMFDPTPRQEGTMEGDAAFLRSVRTATPQVTEDIAGRRIEYFFPIINDADCRVCHGSDHLVRGVAYYSISLDRAFAIIARGRNILIAFFAVSGVLIASVLFSLMKRVVIQPVRSLGSVVQAVGAGDLEVSSEIDTRDEFGLLSHQINTMITGLRERRQLEIDKRVIETSNRENQKYLDNIGEGLLLINRDRTISPQYSAFLVELFGTGEIAGRSFSNFIYPESESNSEESQELDEFIDVIFESVQTEMEMIMSINPLAKKTLMVPDGNGGSRRVVIDAAFHRIMNGDQVENVMVTFVDETRYVEVQEELIRERRRSETELEQIAAVLKIGPASFAEFLEEARLLLGKLEPLVNVQQEGLPDRDKMESLARDLHSLKGTARYLNFEQIGRTIHELETSLGPLFDDCGTASDVGAAAVKAGELADELNAVEDLQKRFLDFTSQAGVEEKNILVFRDSVREMVAKITSDMEKTVEVGFKGNVSHLPGLEKIRPALLHLVRNAIDHGLEETYERVAAGKEVAGMLEFAFSVQDDEIKIIVSDDGAGIDFEAVRTKAIQQGLLSEDSQADRKKLIQLLFNPRFSTRDSATELSGRGVGLDAVQETVQALGGRIGVSTNAGKGTRFTITLPPLKEAP